MVDAVTSQILDDGERNAVFVFTNISDGTGETAALKVDVSALTPDKQQGPCTSVRINKVQYSTFGMAVEILWDASTDVVAQILNGYGVIDLESVGGQKNNSGAGKTGDVLFTTLGASSGDSYTIVLHCVKKYG